MHEVCCRTLLPVLMSVSMEIAAHSNERLFSLFSAYLYFLLFSILVLRAGFGLLIAPLPCHFSRLWKEF